MIPMEEHMKENSSNKRERPCFVQKQHIIIICVVVIAAFVSLIIYGLVSLKSLNDRVKMMERNWPKELDVRQYKGPTSERTKRSTDPASRNILRRLEERLNQSYQSVGRQPAFVLRGPPGKSGRDGIPGQIGIAGRDGTSGTNGRDGRDGIQGVKGNQGNPGQPGPRGISGQKGEQGSPGVTGVSYIRWGKKSCPNNGAKLVYEGYVGGSDFTHRGGAANYVCLTRNPIYEKYQGGLQSDRARIYGAEYQSYSTGIFPSSIYEHEVPCALCQVDTRATQMMIPGRNVCPAGWTREYKGYLMAEKHGHHRSMYTCVDENPDYVQGTHANLNGALFYFVEGVCGSLPCKPYVNGQELTCAVCTH